MDQQDITFYLTSETLPNEAIIKKIVESCEAVDLSGASKSVFYNGLEGFDSDVEYEFEVKPDDALTLSEKYVHNNFTFLEWHHDELLTEISELIEEIGEKSEFNTDSVSLLIGPHEILSLEDNSIIKSEFSFAFYYETELKEDVADLNLKAMKDKDLQEKIKMMEDICKTKLKCFFGGS